MLDKLLRREDDNVITGLGVTDESLMAIIKNLYWQRNPENFGTLLKLVKHLNKPEDTNFNCISNAIFCMLVLKGETDIKKAKKEFGTFMKLKTNEQIKNLAALFTIYDNIVKEYSALVLSGQPIEKKAVREILERHTMYGDVTAKKILANLPEKARKSLKWLKSFWQNTIEPELFVLAKTIKESRERIEAKAKKSMQEADITATPPEPPKIQIEADEETKKGIVEFLKDTFGLWWYGNAFVISETYNKIKGPAKAIYDFNLSGLNFILMLLIVGLGSTIMAILNALMMKLAVFPLMLLTFGILALFIWISFKGELKEKSQKKSQDPKAANFWKTLMEHLTATGKKRAVQIVAPAVSLMFILYLITLSVSKTAAINLLLLVGASTMGLTYLLIGVIREEITVAYLAATLLKNLEIDAQLEILAFLGNDLSAIVKWVGALGKATIRAGLSLVPWAKTEEIEKAFSEFPEFPKLVLTQVFAEFSATIAKLLLRFKAYAEIIDNFFKITLIFQSLFILANNIASISFLAKLSHVNSPLFKGAGLFILLMFAIAIILPNWRNNEAQ